MQLTTSYAIAPNTAAVGPRPTIRSNRQQLSDRFPVLGFTVNTDGLAYYEVLLATDRGQLAAYVRSMLIDPTATSSAETGLYSSRSDSGLISAEFQAYTVPSAVLQRFSRVGELYYSGLAYRGTDLSGATPMHDPQTLATQGPSVTLAPGFTGRTLATILGVPIAKLRLVHGQAAGGLAPDVDPAEDRGEGEDGYGMALESDRADDLAPAWAAGQVADDDGDAHDKADDDYDDGFGGGLGASPEAPTTSEDDSGDADEGPRMATEMESAFPAGAQAPAMLEDEEYRDESAVDTGLEQGDGNNTDYEDGFEAHDAVQLADAPAAPASEPLNTVAKREIIEAVTRVVAAPDGFATIVADDEYAGRRGDHPARGRYHLGLSFGIGLFNQSAGHLGQLVKLYRDRDLNKFREVLGPHADALLEVTNRPGLPAAQAPDGRGPRVQPVGGEDLWSPGWVKRFRDSAHPDLFGRGQPQQFNGAQNQLVAQLFLEPLLPFAKWVGLHSKRALAVLLERAMHLGAGRAMEWALAAVSPIQGPAQRQQALAALGASDVGAFQRAHPGVETTEQWGPLTHAALLAELRNLGARSPLPIATREGELMAAMRRRAAAESWDQRFAAFESLPATEYAL